MGVSFNALRTSLQGRFFENVSYFRLTHLKNIIEEKVQDKTPSSILIGVLFFNNQGKN